MLRTSIRAFSSTARVCNESLKQAVGLVDRLKTNARVMAQLQAVQLAVSAAGPNDGSLMAQMALLTNQTVRGELEKLGEVIEAEGITFTAEETKSLMKVLKNKL